MPFCSSCGKELSGENFCPNCGYPAAGGKPFKAQKHHMVKPGVRSRDLIFKAIEVLKQKPFRLWGISLLCQLLVGLAVMFGVLPIISVPIALVLNAGMVAVYLSGYRGDDVNADALFAGFNRFFKVAGGMGWMTLWIFIWGMIPLAGPVFAIIKSYSYRFVPYIMIQDPNISATDALRLSIKKTEGYKGRMFLADFLVSIAVWVVMLILSGLSLTRGVGIVFLILEILVAIQVALILPLLLGLISAAGYEEFYMKAGAESKGSNEINE